MRTLTLHIVLMLALTYSSFAQDQPESLKDSRGLSHRVEIHPETGSVRWIYDPAVNVVDLGLQANALNEKTHPILLERLLGVFGGILKLRPEQASLKKADTDGVAWFVSYAQVVDGVPVFGTEIGYTVDRAGNVVALGATAYPTLDIDVTPLVSREAALEAARAAFGIDSSQVRNDGELVVLPLHEEGRSSFHLTWQVRLFSLQPLQDVTYFIDARDGRILQDESNLRNLHGTVRSDDDEPKIPSAAEDAASKIASPMALMGGTLSGTVTGSYYPELVTDTPVSSGFKTVDVEVFNSIGQRVLWTNTSSSGSWSSSNLASGNYTIRIPLQNEWVELLDVNDNEVRHETTVWVDANTIYDYAWVADDAPNVRYHASAMHDFFKASPFSYTSMDYQMNAYVDQPAGTCGGTAPVNGCANGTDIFFGTAGGTDWARSSDVVNHEYTHNVIYKIYGNDFIATVNCNTNVHESCAMDEGLSDYFAASKNVDATIGEDVGVNRNLDNDNYEWTAVNGNHWNGQVVGGAAWDVGQAVGDATVGQVLTFKALQITPHAYNFEAFLTNMITADYAYYGGANVCEIHDAFFAHGIGSACVPTPPAPTNLVVSGSVGQNPHLTWTASTGATGYDVYRCTSTSSFCPTYQKIGSSSTTSYDDLNKVLGNACGGGGDELSFYRVRAKNTGGQSGDSNTAGSCTDPSKNGTVVSEDIPAIFALHGNYPNPFNPSTEIRFDLPESAHVRLVVYDAMGREVDRLLDGSMEAGSKHVSWNASGLPSGVYVYRLDAGEFSQTLRMVLMK